MKRVYYLVELISSCEDYSVNEVAMTEHGVYTNRETLVKKLNSLINDSSPDIASFYKGVKIKSMEVHEN